MQPLKPKHNVLEPAPQNILVKCLNRKYSNKNNEINGSIK